MIRFIVETVSSNTDRNGNRYHFARVTSTHTGRDVVIAGVGGDRNAPSIVRRILQLDWSEVYEVHSQVSKREFKAAEKMAVGDSPTFEHMVSESMLLALES